jgi:hypothetical protein
MLGTLGLALDYAEDMAISSVAMPWLRHYRSADDAVPKVGADSGMPQYPGESIDAYRARVLARWPTYRNAGSEQSVIEQLLAYGFTPTLGILSAWRTFGASSLTVDGPESSSPAISVTEGVFGTIDGGTEPDESLWIANNVSFSPAYSDGEHGLHATATGTVAYHIRAAVVGVGNEALRFQVWIKSSALSWVRLVVSGSGDDIWFNASTGEFGSSGSAAQVSRTALTKSSGDGWLVVAEFSADPTPGPVYIHAVDGDGQASGTATSGQELVIVDEPVILAATNGEHGVFADATNIPTDKLVEVRFLARCDADRPWLRVALDDDYVFINTATRATGATVAPGGQATVRARRPDAPWVIVRARFWPTAANAVVKIHLANADEGEAYTGDGTSSAYISDLTIGTPEPLILRDNEAGAPDRLNWWSQFWVIVSEGTHSYTSSIPADDQIAIESLVGKWKPTEWSTQEVIFVTGGTVADLMSGRTADEWAADLLPDDHSELTVSL